MYRIYIVEDDAVIAKTVAEGLAGWGYEVSTVQNFSNVLEEFHAVKPHLVLLDISLPHRSGYHWCTEIRKTSQVPVVFVSSAADNMSMVTALHQGADDFIAKPFDMAVLVAKVQALLRRSYDFVTEGSGDTLAHRGAVLNLGDACLWVGDAQVELTRNEMRILELLLQQKGRVVSRDMLMRRLWEHESFIDDNTLTVNMTRLRKKLGAAGLEEFITTKKGMGYTVL